VERFAIETQLLKFSKNLSTSRPTKGEQKENPPQGRVFFLRLQDKITTFVFR